jgi:uncharacterized protein (UPF0335 family)
MTKPATSETCLLVGGFFMFNHSMEKIMANVELKKLNSRIQKLGKKTAAWREEVQACLIGCVYQAIEGDSNIDPCIQIIKQLQGADVKAVMHWLEKHAPVIVRRGSFVFNKSFVGEYDPIYLLANPWWDIAVKPAQVSSSIDFREQLDAFIKRMEREVEKGEKNIEHKEVLAEVKALAGKLSQAAIEV